MAGTGKLTAYVHLPNGGKVELWESGAVRYMEPGGRVTTWPKSKRRQARSALVKAGLGVAATV